jgi:DNA-binding IclR family transcriptional regulator
MEETKKTLRAADVAEILDISKSKAYSIIKTLNAELKENGFIVVAGRVPRKYFDERAKMI